MKKGIALIAILAMIMTLFSVPVYAVEDPEVTPVAPNYAFIPNSGEASVSKVDLVSMEEVARYFTEPRGTLAQDYDWRTSRIAMDADGNAWVLNTGADGTGLQGSVVRILSDTTGLTTNTDPTAPLPFGTDQAVTKINVGGLGDMPRAIAIDKDGFIWIGFYSSGALMKYSFDGTNLVPEFDTPIFNEGNKLNYYEMKFDKDGTLFISSRNSTPTRTGVYGVWSFDPNTELFTSEWVTNPYSLLIDPVSGQVYATSYSNQLWIRGETTPEAIEGATNLRGMAFDGLGNIWIANTAGGAGGNQIFWYNIADKTSGFITLPIGNTPVGVGKDEAGLMWAVCRTDNGSRTAGGTGGYIVAFDPATKAFVPNGNIQVGFRPYAYGEFVVPAEPELYNLCGFKLDDATGDGLEGWTIYLEMWDPELTEPGWVPIGSTTTDPEGRYCFSDLPAGDYRISEDDEDGWVQVYPGGNGMHEITLPDDLTLIQNLIENGDFEQGNMEFMSEYDYVSAPGSNALYPAGVYAIGTNPSLYHDLWESYGDHTSGTGNMMIVNGEDIASNKIVWSDTAEVTPGEEYSFSFWGATSYPAAYSSLDVYINDVLIDTYHAPEFLAEWTKYATTWTPDIDVTEAAIKLVCSTQVYTGNDFALDDIMFTAHDLDFRNMEETLYDIAGYKLDADTDEGLAGWVINLEMWDDTITTPAFIKVDERITDENGKYCFEGLEAGEYRVSEVLKDGWVQDFPINNEHMITLPAEASDCDATLGDEGKLFYNFINGELSNLCGFKYGVNWMDQEAMDNPLAGWTITLLDDDEEVVATTTTDALGHYCFMNLRGGDYTIVESYGDMNDDGFWTFDGKFWRPVGSDEHHVTLPADGTNCDMMDTMHHHDMNCNHHNFFNQCFTNETAWMFGELRFIEDLALNSNNWGWSHSLGILTGTAIDTKIVDHQPIYAGAGQGDVTKGYLVGWIDVFWNGSEVTWNFAPNGDSVLINEKIWVGNTALPMVKEGKSKVLRPTNAPGKLIVDPNVDFTKEAFIAIHFESYVPCGFPAGNPMPQ